ncbi:Protein GLE1 [Zea mays]|uniref:mRNA export factor GLE1 n=1 Tax=Zea mays TaxID=4577 RepID=A0A1D6L8Y8_MAIZE|nr:Protein GLE1 [Zea mays]
MDRIVPVQSLVVYLQTRDSYLFCTSLNVLCIGLEGLVASNITSVISKIISIVKSRNTKDRTFGNLAFACGYVMLLVTNQVPDAMDYLLAEFNRVCIYTVPKHLHALNTEIKGVRHPHGLAEGWKWLAMFLNSLPATTATACALHAFLKMAGFALHKKYGSQFMKILYVISRYFLPALKEQGNKMQAEAVNNLQNYLNDKIYLEEPEGQYLVQQLLSKELFM